MSASTNGVLDLTSRNIRCWFVVGYADLRGGVHYWRCMLRDYLMAEKIIAEQDILDPKRNAITSLVSLLQEAEENPTGWIYGEWKVLGPAAEHASQQLREPGAFWRCRCVCGTEW